MQNTKIKHRSSSSWMLCLLFAIGSHAQFVERSAELNIALAGSYSYFGAGTSFYDFNQDGLDDLTFCSTDSGAQVFENAGGYFIERFYFASLTGELKHAVWVDFDNDGDNDFFATRMNAKPYLMRNEGDFTFTDISNALPCPDDAPFSTCCSWGDYDNDSFLDVYVVNYYFDTGLVSWLFHNNGDGTFEEVGTTLNVNNGINPGFQCLWIDYNQDGDLDLIVLNDKYHGNKLYDNDGNGNFVDIGGPTAFDRIADNMGITISDFDHDGDFDFYVTITEGNFLLRNDNGVFTDVGEDFHVDTHCTSWACPFIDADNMTWEDLYVLSTSVCNSTINYFYENLQGQDFMEHTDMFDESNEATAYSASKGDWNNDGLYDIIVSDGPVTSMKFWENQNTSGNWIKINLEGTVSNSNGIGSIVKCYVGNDCLMRAVTCGDNFMSQDTQNIIIGIGNETVVDSLTIVWPSGWTDTFYDLGAVALYHFTEGETLLPFVHIDQQFCAGDTLLLDAGNGTSYSWSNGLNTQEIEITQPGTFNVEIQNQLGVPQHIEFVTDTFELEDIPFAVYQPLCFQSGDGAIEIDFQTADIDSVFWADGSTEFFRNSLDEGIYTCTIHFNNGCETNLNFNIIQPEIIVFNWSTDTVCFNESTAVDWQASGGNSPLFVEWNGYDPVMLGAGEYPVIVSDNHDCMLRDTVRIFSFPEISFSYVADTLCEGDTIALQYEFDGIDDASQIQWLNCDPDSMLAGDHTVIVTNTNGCTLTSEIHLEESNEMQISSIVYNAMNGNNGSVELSISGGIPPYTFQWSNDSVSNPLLNIGQGTYSVILQDAAGCEALISDIEIIDTSVEEMNSLLSISPNPFTEHLNISMPDQNLIMIYDLFGHLIYQFKSQSLNCIINTTHWSSGVYFLVAGNHRYKLIRT